VSELALGIGGRTLAQLEDNLGAARWKLNSPMSSERGSKPPVP